MTAISNFYKARVETPFKDLMLYLRGDSPYWYARLRKPSSPGAKTAYLNRSLKTTSLELAQIKAIEWRDAQLRRADGFDSSLTWDALWERLRREEHDRNSLGYPGFINRTGGVWSRWLKPYIDSRGVPSITDFDENTFSDFCSWRRTYFRVNKKTSNNAKTNPRSSTLRLEFNTVLRIIRKFYFYARKPCPEFSFALKEQRVSETHKVNRENRVRGFVILEEHLEEMDKALFEWAYNTPARHHRFMRMRLYWTFRFCIDTRARPGTEVYNLRWSDMRFQSVGDGIETAVFQTSGKMRSRFLYLSPGFTQLFLAEWKGKARSEFGKDYNLTDSSYVFPGCQDRAGGRPRIVNGDFAMESRLHARMWADWLNTKDEAGSFRYQNFRCHDKSVTGGRGDIRVTPYSWRSTAITNLILSKGQELSPVEIASLCGASLQTIHRYYTDADALVSADKLRKWTVPGTSLDNQGDFTSKAKRSIALKRKAQEHFNHPGNLYPNIPRKIFEEIAPRMSAEHLEELNEAYGEQRTE